MTQNAQIASHFKNQGKKVLLIIMDGWGVAEENRGNAITKARPSFYEHLLQNYPSTLLQASSHSVGLPWGEMGNSEVGHFTIGSGRIVKQSLYRINHEIETGRFYENAQFLKTLLHVKSNNSTLHIMGILGSGGVHGTSEHLYPLLKMAKKQKIEKVKIHFFLDGRDAPKDSALRFIKEAKKKIRKSYKKAQIATLCGRHFAMDRNNNWQRIKKAYDAIVFAKAENNEKDAIKAIKKQYEKNHFDEKIEPILIGKQSKENAINSGDGIIFYNFRADRARQITKAISEPNFSEFETKKVENISFTTFTKYADELKTNIAFERENISNYLGEVISKAGLTQLHAAETEKYAHVTYFLNGMNETELKGEQRILIPSPPTPSFDEVPEMAALELTEEIIKKIKQNTHDFYVMNFANPDMVGHTGNLEATIKAITVVDECLKKIVTEMQNQGGVTCITADHGNAEEVSKLLSGDIDKEHSTNPVPFIIVDENLKGKTAGVTITNQFTIPVTGVLADVAPTVLSYYNIEKPAEMTGVNLKELIL